MNYTRECYSCGSKIIVQARGGRVFCDECKDLDRPRLERKQSGRHNTKYAGDYYTIILDPDPIGGFNPNTILDSTSHSKMLEHGSYTTGTILKDKSGNELIIVPVVGKIRQVCLSYHG